MVPIIYCLSQPYDGRLVALAIGVCLAASFTAFSLYSRAIAEADKANAPLWIALTAITAGSAAWATHFTAMLAFDPATPVGFDILMTVASFGVAMLITGAAFLCATYYRQRSGQVLAGVVLGIATAAMHYTGVSGLELAGRFHWSAPVIVVSVALSIVFSVAALVACGNGVTYRQRTMGSLLFALSIAALHFTGMAAVTIVPDAAKRLPRGLLSGDLLAVSVGIVTLLIVGAAASAWLIDRRARRESDVRLRFMARHDGLTSLPNRLLFEEIAKFELTDLAAAQRTAAILCLDLDGFKEVNDIFGHAAGDALLIEVARRLQGLLGERCLAARLGGDEFAVLATGLGAVKTATTAAQSVLDVLCAPYTIEGSKVDIGCSIGISMFPADSHDYQHLLARADIALSRAKTDGRGVFRFFEPVMDEMLQERRRLARDLRAALNTDQIRLVFQPLFDFANEKVSGFEALVRWDHPEMGPIDPVIFIPIAEESGAILPLGEWVLREACREAASWSNPLTVAVNLSVAQFRQSELFEMTESILQETGLSPKRLELEVTESLFFESLPKTVQVLERLKELGIRISMDDFGTGFSSLSTLQSFAFDKIKIDRSFTVQIGKAGKGAAIVKAVIGLGDALGLAVVAEGVETAEQMTFLRRQNCSQGQGYFYGKPMPIACYSDLTRFDAAREKRVA